MALRLVKMHLTNSGDQQAFLTTEKIESIFKQMVYLKTSDIIFIGDDIFSYPDFLTILTLAGQHKLNTSIFTNWQNINPLALNKLAELPYLILIRLDLVSTVFESSLPNLLSCVRQLKERNIQLGLNAILAGTDFGEISDYLQLVQKERLSFITFALQDTDDKSFLDYGEFLTNILQAVSSYGELLNQSPVPLPPDTEKISNFLASKCPAGEIILHILNDGTVKGCAHVNTPGYSLDQASLSVIYDLINQRRQKIDLAQFKGKCKECSNLINCLGGCSVQKQKRGRLFYSEQPRCIKDVVLEVLEKTCTDSAIRRVISGIVQRQGINLNYGVPACHNDLPIWLFPFKDN